MSRPKTEEGENCMLKSFSMFTPVRHEFYSGHQMAEEEMGRMLQDVRNGHRINGNN
jgi:hypothetical protein